jgi:hypothetical protein
VEFIIKPTLITIPKKKFGKEYSMALSLSTKRHGNVNVLKLASLQVKIGDMSSKEVVVSKATT